MKVAGSAKKEINFYRALQGKHPNLLEIYNIYTSKNNVYIVMEYCRDGDLRGILKKKRRISEDEAIKVLKATISGLAFLQENEIMHRDIKPGNIIYDKGVYKICDYGLSKVIDPNTVSTMTACGTPVYMPPEILRKDYRYAPNVDTFAAGVMVYECLYGNRPWDRALSKFRRDPGFN